MRKFVLKEDQSGAAPCVTLKWLCCALALLTGLCISKYNKAWGVIAVQELASGELQEYSQQAYERYHILSNAKDLDVVLEEFAVKPELMFFLTLKKMRVTGKILQ